MINLSLMHDSNQGLEHLGLGLGLNEDLTRVEVVGRVYGLGNVLRGEIVALELCQSTVLVSQLVNFILLFLDVTVYLFHLV